MKILETRPIAGHRVETDEPEYNQYIRYGADCWFVQMGESDEPVYDCKELERAYQEHTKPPNSCNYLGKAREMYEDKDDDHLRIDTTVRPDRVYGPPSGPHGYEEEVGAWLMAWVFVPTPDDI